MAEPGGPKNRLFRSVRHALLGDPASPQSSGDQGPDKSVRVKVAEDPTTPAAQLCALANDRSLRVREAVARNVAAPGDALEHLAQDKLLSVRALVVRNPSVNPEALQILSGDAEDEIRMEVASHPHANVETLRSLARAPDPIALHVVNNPMTPRDVLEQLAMDPSPLLHEAARNRLALLGIAFSDSSSDATHVGQDSDYPDLDGDAEDSTASTQSDLSVNPSLDTEHEYPAPSALSAPPSITGSSKNSVADSHTPMVAQSTPVAESSAGPVDASTSEAVGTRSTFDTVEVVNPKDMIHIEANARAPHAWIAFQNAAPQRLWLSPKGRWLCVQAFAEDEGFLCVVDTTQESLLATVDLMDDDPEDNDLDVAWTSNEDFLVVVEGKSSWAGLDAVHVHAFQMESMRRLIRTSIEDERWNEVRPRGIYFSQDGKRFGVSLTDAIDGADVAGMGIVTFELDSGKRTDLLPWTMSRYFPIMRADLACAYLISQGELMQRGREGATYLMISCGNQSKAIELTRRPNDYCTDNMWLSLDENSLFILMDDDHGLTGVLQVDLDKENTLPNRIPWDDFDPPPHQLWTFPSHFDGGISVADDAGSWQYTIDIAANAVTRSALESSVHEAPPQAKASETPLAEGRRKQIPLELPKLD